MVEQELPVLRESQPTRVREERDGPALRLQDAGKTVTARALLGLSADRAEVAADRLEVAGTDARGFRERDWRRLRGTRVGYVGQEALGALDPLRPVGREVADALRLHTSMRAAERVEAVRTALADVGLDPAIATDGRLAGTLSGGMRQRALIAAATIGSPALVVADEPTTALDAGVAVAVMEQLRRAQQRGAGVLVITHDLGLVAGWADRVAVVADGRIVEQGPVGRVFDAPEHPATAALVHAAAPAPAPVPAPAPAPALAPARCEDPNSVFRAHPPHGARNLSRCDRRCGRLAPCEVGRSWSRTSSSVRSTVSLRCT
ncbi:ATP-binding cassette domain-containing protein, partial [Curtobacterium sp. B8]|uniref:ATP-binding cassette domain-containing protein n=1 Tax=Curtobacterium sp. B8 TaxID=95611 RepID=UPI0003B7A805